MPSPSCNRSPRPAGWGHDPHPRTSPRRPPVPAGGLPAGHDHTRSPTRRAQPGLTRLRRGPRDRCGRPHRRPAPRAFPVLIVAPAALAAFITGHLTRRLRAQIHSLTVTINFRATGTTIDGNPQLFIDCHEGLRELDADNSPRGRLPAIEYKRRWGEINRPDFCSYREPCPAGVGLADSRSA